MTARPSWRRARGVTVVAAAVAAAVTLTATPSLASKTVHPYRTDGQSLNMRSGPGTGYSIVTTIPATAAFTANCWVSAQSVNGDPIWLNSTYGSATGWTADYYVDTHWSTTADLTAQGIPPCSSGSTSGDADSVWVGMPFSGRWPNADGCAGASFPSSSCSLPAYHWWLANAPQGDYGMDLQGVAVGTPVRLYAAPRDSSVPVTAHVDAVGPACRSGVIANGGYRVTIGLFVRGTRIGSVTYAHVNPSVSADQWISRWGTQIGTVGGGYDTSAGCWGGPHVHFQSYAQSGYSCYNRSVSPGQALSPTNFLGFVTGRYASAPRRACP